MQSKCTVPGTGLGDRRQREEGRPVPSYRGFLNLSVGDIPEEIIIEKLTRL